MNEKTLLRKVKRKIKIIPDSSIEVQLRNKIVNLKGFVSSYDDYIAIGHYVGQIPAVQGIVNNLIFPGKKKKQPSLAHPKKIIGKADIVIIGGGVIGCAIARELSKYQFSIIVLEKEADVASGTSKANNALVHTGLGESDGTLKQRLCMQGHDLFKKLATDLNVPFKKTGMWLLLSEDSLKTLKIPKWSKKILCKYVIPFIILRKANKLGILLEKVNIEEFKKIEPKANENIVSAIFSPTYAAINPYLMTISLAENAIENGVKFFCNTEVTHIITTDQNVSAVGTSKGVVLTSMVINAAGVNADDIAAMAGAREYTIHPKKGATALFDTILDGYISHPMTLVQFPKPSNYKGGGVLYTVDGNIQWGPTIQECQKKTDTSVTKQELDEIFMRYQNLVPAFPKNLIIQFFTGIRACTFTEDFIIRPAINLHGFIHVAGIQSPGLTAAPAIAEMVSNLLRESGWNLQQRADFNAKRKKPVVFHNLSTEEKKKLIAINPLYGNVVCRCEEVTEGEIVDAIYSSLPVTTLDAVKRRTRACMGRCQGGFCLMEVARILSRETGTPLEEITKKGNDSQLFFGKTKCLLQQEDA